MSRRIAALFVVLALAFGACNVPGTNQQLMTSAPSGGSGGGGQW